MTKYQRTAAKAIQEYLEENSSKKTVSLYSLSAVADNAAFSAGKKRELFNSLYDYEKLLPKGTKVAWVNNFLSVINPFCTDNAPVQEDVFIPGPYDTAVDMGPVAWTSILSQN
jgi:hypothetical protein